MLAIKISEKVMNEKLEVKKKSIYIDTRNMKTKPTLFLRKNKEPYSCFRYFEC